MTNFSANPELASCFLVEIDGIAEGAFKAVKIGDSEWPIGENRSGIDPLIKSTYSGIKKPTTIELTKVLVEGAADTIRTFTDWHSAGSTDKRNGAIVHLDRTGAEVMRYNFSDGWVSKVKVPDLDATDDNAELGFVFTLSISEFKAV